MSDTVAIWTSPLLDLLFEDSSVGRCLVAPDGSVLRANAEWLRSTGFSLDDVLGANIVELFPEARDIVLATHGRARAGHRVEVSRHSQRLHGQETWWEGTIDPVPMEGGLGVLIVACEVTAKVAVDTERKRAEEAIRDSELRYATMFHRSPLAKAWNKLPEGTIAEVNDAWVALTGIPREEAIGKTGVELGLVEPEPRRRFHEDVLAHGSAETELTISTRTRGARLVFTRIELVSLSGKQFLLGVMLDVTERKRAEEALRESEERFRLAAVASRAMVYDLDLRTMRVREFAGLHGLLGYESGDVQMTLEWWDRQVLPEDLPRIRAALGRRKQGDTGSNTLEYRVRHKDGRIIPVEDNALLLWDQGGNVARIVGAVVDVTERKLAEKGQRASEEQLRQTLKDAAAGTWEWDLASGELTWAPELYALFGLDPREGIDYARWEERVHPDDLDAVNAAGRDTVEGRVPEYRGEFRIIHPERGVRWLLATGRVERAADGTALRIRGLNLDITERKHAEKAQEQASAKVRALFENVDVGVALVDESGRFAQYNRRFLDLFGLAPDSTVANVNDADWGRWSVVDAEERPLEVDDHPVRKATRTGGRIRSQLVGMRRPSGRDVIWMLVSAESLAGADGRQILCTYQDVTGMRHAEQVLRETDRRKNQFLGVLSHELRNPLAPIRNSIHVMELAGPASEAARRAREVLRRQADLLTRLVDDLLDISRITYGKIELQLARLDARDVARRACDDARGGFDHRGVALHYVDTAEPTWVAADAARLAQMVGNLLGNALKFTPPAGQVTVRVGRREGRCEIAVRDSGAGIESPDLDRIFDPFVQAERTRERKHGGLGIGLALVKELAERHGGTIRASSEGPGRGSEFTLSLPLAPAPLHAVGTTAKPTSSSPLTVLVVEDNEDAASTLADLLSLAGHAVRVTHSGREGIHAAAAQRPDVLICDIGLPDINGHEVIKAIRSAGAEVFAVALTGYAQPQDRDLALKAGFDAHLGKPPPLDELHELLARAAKKKGEGLRQAPRSGAE